MFIYLLEKKKFVIGCFNEVINFFLNKKDKTEKSFIVLPCSLNDLALDENFSYKNVDFYTSDSVFLTYFFRFKLRKKIERVYGPDLMLMILQKETQASSKKKHYFLAPNNATTIALAKLLKNHYRNIVTDYGFLPKNSNHSVELHTLQKIIKTKPDIIWLGIGSPKQVELAVYLKKRLKNCTIFCVGAAFDFLTGQKKQAPFYLRNLGLEWFFRLLTEPKRLWKRYLITIPKYLCETFFQKVIRKDHS